LHSFTVGAPLSFLDHHLRHGDSLFGAWVADTGDQLAKRGSMLLHQAVDKARGAAAGMARIEDLADADLAQVKESVKIFEAVEEATAPLSDDGWVLEPKPVLSLLDHLKGRHPSLKEYAGVVPLYGLKTGFNEAFLVDATTRDQLVAHDPASAPVFRPF